MPNPLAVLITCEHATNRVPVSLISKIPKSILKTHRGYDIGALELAEYLSRRMEVKLIRAKVSRLAVDLNRSEGNRRSLHSPFLRELNQSAKTELVNRYYFPYRAAVASAIEKKMTSGKTVLHLSVHTFTPVLNGKRRPIDIGLLFDPHRKKELSLCQKWRVLLRNHQPKLRIRFNHPYRGTADGHTTALRRRFPSSKYAGIELEINQIHPLGSRLEWSELKKQILQSLESLIVGPAS